MGCGWVPSLQEEQPDVSKEERAEQLRSQRHSSLPHSCVSWSGRQKRGLRWQRWTGPLPALLEHLLLPVLWVLLPLSLLDGKHFDISSLVSNDVGEFH